MIKMNELRHLFPIVNNTLYFDAASLTPYCTPVINVVDRFIKERRDYASSHFEKWKNELESCRVLAAGLLGASSDEIALTKNTSEGVNLTAQLIDWSKGDEVLVCDCDFPTNILPFSNLKEKGVRVKFIECSGGKVPITEIEEGLSESTKLLSISHVFYNSGYRVDLDEVSQLCSENDVLLHVDAAQSLGAFKIDVKTSAIDFLSAPGFKWLLSPIGTGLFYAKKEHINKTPVIGWLSVKDFEKLKTRDYETLDSARRFEAGTLDIGGFLGMKAALSLIESISTNKIEKRVLDLSLKLAEGLQNFGLTVKSDLEKGHRSGIISVEKGEISKDFLKRKNITATIREDLRLSPFIYNNEEDIESVLRLLTSG
jgi:selenocysteine lyase/cysteine desulfurase